MSQIFLRQDYRDKFTFQLELSGSFDERINTKLTIEIEKTKLEINGNTKPHAKSSKSQRYTFVPTNKPPVKVANAYYITLIFAPASGKSHPIEWPVQLPAAQQPGGYTITATVKQGLVEVKALPIIFEPREWGLPSVRMGLSSPIKLTEWTRVVGLPAKLMGYIEEVNRWLQASAPRATYPVHDNNEVMFYNDGSTDANGTAGAFADIYRAIAEAEHFIFIADWSFHPHFHIQRPTVPGKEYRIGDILIKKAMNYAKMVIAIHVWDHFGPPFADDAKSNAAYEDLRKIGADYTGVFPTNLLWRRTERSGTSARSHHQKYIILDAPSATEKGRREVKVFFGGLDLTTGRFDWKEHPIFAPTPNAFASYEDWYNQEFDGDPDLRLMPRQPWHDIHARLLGPAAWDFVYEFVGRWNAKPRKTVGFHGDKDELGLVWKAFERLLSERKLFVSPFEAPAQNSRPWSMQVYRSMEQGFWSEPDGNYISLPYATKFFPWGIDKPYEKSIHKAYLQAIKRAERFIYIETQYLIAAEKAPNNRIPEAIVNRIIERHKEEKPFHVYIVLPMFPEGKPQTFKNYPVRYFQWKTIQKMVHDVQQGLVKLGKHWQDYLSFYFLAKRNPPLTGQALNSALGQLTKKTDRKSSLLRNQRYMIYVHSKMMIVDDRWIIIGSANLNQRSMAGWMDSEICVGMWPSSASNQQVCEQQLKLFRKELWQEHLGNTFWGNPPSTFDADRPEVPNTYYKIQDAATSNYKWFTDPNYTAQQDGHLMMWPVVNGKIEPGFITDRRVENDHWRIAPTRRGAYHISSDEGYL